MTFIPPHIQADPELLAAYRLGQTSMYTTALNACTQGYENGGLEHTRQTIVTAYQAAQGAA